MFILEMDGLVKNQEAFYRMWYQLHMNAQISEVIIEQGDIPQSFLSIYTYIHI